MIAVANIYLGCHIKLGSYFSLTTKRFVSKQENTIYNILFMRCIATELQSRDLRQLYNLQNENENRNG